MVTYRVQDDALLKILLHSAKFPSQSVNGVLLGKTRSDGDNGTDALLSEVIPLFHSALNLSVGLEVALIQVEAYAAENNLELLAYYYSDARFATSDLPQTGKRVLDRLHEHNSKVCGLLLDNKKLLEFSKKGSMLPLELFVKDNSTKAWKKISLPGAASGPSLRLTGSELTDVSSRFAQLCAQQRHKKIADFDEHLDDITRDYLNKGLKLEA